MTAIEKKANEVIALMGQGAILKAPKDGAAGGLVHRSHDTILCPNGDRNARVSRCECQYTVEPEVIGELRKPRYELHQLAEQASEDDSRPGWRDLGLRDAGAEYFTLFK